MRTIMAGLAEFDKLTPFGLAIRKLRLEKGLKLMDMGKKLGLSAAFLSAIETGRKSIPDGFVVKISRALELRAEYIAKLRRAADRTRKEIRVDNKTEEDRELIAAFARRLDEVPSAPIERLKKLLLKSISGEIPFQRKRQAGKS
jgi:transcriptional regulator with XRE-family HTH domain